MREIVITALREEDFSGAAIPDAAQVDSYFNPANRLTLGSDVEIGVCDREVTSSNDIDA